MKFEVEWHDNANKRDRIRTFSAKREALVAARDIARLWGKAILVVHGEEGATRLAVTWRESDFIIEYES